MERKFLTLDQVVQAYKDKKDNIEDAEYEIIEVHIDPSLVALAGNMEKILKEISYEISAKVGLTEEHLKGNIITSITNQP